MAPAILRSNPTARGLTADYRTVWDPAEDQVEASKEVPPGPMEHKASRPRPIAGVAAGRCSVNSNIVRVMRDHGFTRMAVTEDTATFRHEGRKVEVVARSGGRWHLQRRGHIAVEGQGWRKLNEVIGEIV